MRYSEKDYRSRGCIGACGTGQHSPSALLARALAARFCVLAAALITDRMIPLYEPILLGWPIELAGFVIMLAVTGILWGDEVHAFRESVRLRTERNEMDILVK